MKLFLASEGKNPESLEKLNKFLGKLLAKCRIAYIVTAANGEMGYGSWRGSETIQIVKKLGAEITVIELENYMFENVLEKIRGNDVIWFAGGQPGYLLYWIRRVGLDKELPRLLKSGMVYVGSSAGSMIAGPTLFAAENFPGDQELGASIIPGLGFIDFEIFPHFENEQLPAIKKFWRKGKLCLLKDGEAITVVDGKISILGGERFIEK